MKLHSIFLLALLFGFSHSQMASAQMRDLNCADPLVFCMDEFLGLAAQASSIEMMAERLPLHVKRNVTFKRGNNIEKVTVGILGPHGHKVPASVSGSATPQQPRIFVWDEKSGFTASWNSGNVAHSAHDRVDLYDFDFTKNEHRLLAWFPEGNKSVDADFKDDRGLSCISCHGQVQRPIFPMYPDWPQFYGEFNDEMAGYPAGMNALRSDLRAMANQFQPTERNLFATFLKGEGSSNARYSPILSVRPEAQNSNRYYPFRPRNTTTPFSDVSRSFYHRPNLRLGVVYNRLTALQTFEKIKRSPIFKKFPDVIFYSLMDCDWDFVEGQGEAGRQQILGPMISELQKYERFKDINLRGAKFSESELNPSERTRLYKATENGTPVYYQYRDFKDKNYQQIPFEDLLKVLDLNINDMDIRFRHDSSLKVSRGYNVYDPKAFYYTDSAMDIGYIEPRYALNPICDNNSTRCNFSYTGTYMDGKRYFNSYFDGSATTNELLVAQILLYLTDVNQDFSRDPELDSVRKILRAKVSDPRIYFETLQQKYSRFTDRLKLDKPFFDKMDRIGPWIQLPFPPDMLNIQNREAFWGSSPKTANIRARHAQWLSREDRRNNRQNRNGGRNLCWNIYESLNERYRK